MNPDDKYKFGSSVKKTMDAPLSSERMARYARNRGKLTTYVASEKDLRTNAEKDSANKTTHPIVSFGNSPEELQRQKDMRDVTRRLDEWRMQQMERNPAYKHALTGDVDDDFFRVNKGTKFGTLAKFAISEALEKERIISEELNAKDEIYRQVRRTGAVFRFGASLLQDILRGGVGILVAGPLETASKLAPGGMPMDSKDGITWKSDSTWYKFLFGTERERDHLGRVISEKSLPIESITARAKRYEDDWRKNTPEDQRGTLKGELIPVIGSKFGAMGMYMLEMDVSVLPIKTASVLLKSSVAVRRTGSALIDIVEKAGVAADDVLRKEAQNVASKALKAKNQLESQKIVNAFIKSKVPEGSVARETVEAIERDIADEMTNARTVLYNQASKSDSPETFIETVTNTLKAERGLMRNIIEEEIKDTQTSKAFVDATKRYEELFAKYGDQTTPESQYTGKLTDDAPADVVKEFDNLKTEIADIVENQIDTMARRLGTLEDDIPLGKSTFDFTKNLLDDSGEELEPMLRRIYNEAKERKDAGVRAISGATKLVKDEEVLDSLELIQRQLLDARLQNAKTTALEKANAYMYAEAVARGILPKTKLNLFQKPIEASVKAAKAVPTTVNERQFIDAGKVGISDTLIKAAQDVEKYEDVGDFIKNSEEVVYQAETPNSFVRDEAVSRKLVGGELNPPVVLAMKQPLDLRKAGESAWEDVIQFIDPALYKAGVRSFTPDEAGALLEKARLFGYDGLIYARTTAEGASEGTGRLVLHDMQAINAYQFFDNIRGGIDNMGNGISMMARRREVAENFVDKVMLKIPGFKALENKLASFGLSKKVAHEQMLNVYAALLNRYLMKDAKTLLKKDINQLHDDFQNIMDWEADVRARLVFTSKRGLEVVLDKEIRPLLDADQVTDMYSRVVKSFDKDVVKRTKEMSKTKIGGGVTEADFVAKGKGHAAFNEGLKELIDTGVFLPEEALLVRTAMADVADEVLERVPMLQRSRGWIKAYGRSRFALGKFTDSGKAWVDGVRLRRGLSYTYMHRLSKDGRVLNPITEQRFATEVFLHEYGHIGFRTMLTKAQQKQVKKLFESLSDKEKMEIFGNEVINNVENFRHFLEDENEFFAQAYAQYVLRNRLTHAMLEPLFKRVTNALKAGMKALIGAKPSEKLDALTPLFEQVLRGESKQKGGLRTFRDADLPKNIKRAWDDDSIIDEFAKKRLEKRTPLATNGRRDFVGSRKLTSRQAADEARKILLSSPKGKGIPKQYQKTVLAKPRPTREQLKEAKKPRKELLDAKVPDDIAEMDPLNPKLLKSLTPERIFGKGVRVGGTLRKGQEKLYKTVATMQKRWVSDNKRSTDAIEALKERIEDTMKKFKGKLKTEQEARDSYLQLIKFKKAQLKALYGINFSRAQTDELMRMALKVHNPKSFRVAAQKIDEFFDEQLRKESLRRIGTILNDTKKGTDRIPVKWQERIEEVFGPRGIQIKGFKEGYEKRLKALQEHIEKKEAEYLEMLAKDPETAIPPEHMEWDFKSPKTIAMLEHLEELGKKKSKEFTTLELLKITQKIEQLFEEGRIAQFVINGGKTKEISRLIEVVDPKTGKPILNKAGTPQTKKFIVQKGGEYVPGIKELRTKNQLQYMRELKDGKQITNIDSEDILKKKYGDLNEDTSVLGQVQKNLKEGKDKGWLKWIGLNYLTVDRVFELMDNFKFRGPMYQLIRKPLSEAIAKGEDAAGAAINKLGKTEEMLEAKHGMKFTDANYERISIYAYLRQRGGRAKLEKSGVSKADIKAAERLSAPELEMYTFMREELDKLWPAVDKTMREVHGQRIGRVENYFPIQNNLLDSRKVHEVLLDEFTVRKRAVQKNFTKERYTVTKGMEMRLNARDIFMKHMRDTNYFTNVESEIQRVSALVRDPEFADIVGTHYTRFLNSWIDIVARRGTPQNYNFNLWDVLHRNLGAATLGFNPSPILKQPLAVFSAGGLIGLDNIALNGFGLMHRHQLFDAIANVSTEIRLRALDDPSFTEFALTRRLGNLQRRGYEGIKRADAWTTRGVWLAAYSKRLGEKGKLLNPDDFKNGLNIDQDALDYADTIVRKTQGSGKFQDLPLMLSTNNKKVWRTIFQFQSFVLSQSQMLTHDALHRSIVALKASKNGADLTVKDATGRALKIGGSIATGIYLEDEITQALTGLYGSESYEQYLDDRSASKRFVDGLSSALPPFGIVAGLMEPDNATLGVPVFDKILLGSKNAVNTFMVEDGDDKLRAASRALEAVVALATGAPGTGFTGTLFRGQLIGMDQWFKKPYEEYKEALEKGDRAAIGVLDDKYEEEGLNVKDIKRKAIDSYKRDQQKEDRERAEKAALMLYKAEDEGDKEKVREYLRKLKEKGLLTEAFKKEFKSELKSLKRKDTIGEL